jgi:virginiamycin A acetyltransferase
VKIFRNVLKLFYTILKSEDISWIFIGKLVENSILDKNTIINSPCSLKNVKIEYGSYISQNSRITNTQIGKFCSIGPNFLCGWGMHPLSGISTSPLFYSTNNQFGFSYTSKNIFKETSEIKIGNDVFIGSNVTILDGVCISDGAVIAAGSVVTTDVPPYAIVGGVPAKIIKYRFTQDVILNLLKIKWWNFDTEKIKSISDNFYDIDNFIKENLSD